MRLFDNPFMQAAVAASWSDVQALLDLGVTLEAKSATRLSWDLETGLRDRLRATREAEDAAEEVGDEQRATSEYLLTLDALHERGYHTRPAVESLLETMDRLKMERDEAQFAVATSESEHDERYRDLQARFEALEQEINFFGRKRQRYLKNVARGVRRPPPRS